MNVKTKAGALLEQLTVATNEAALSDTQKTLAKIGDSLWDLTGDLDEAGFAELYELQGDSLDLALQDHVKALESAADLLGFMGYGAKRVKTSEFKDLAKFAKKAEDIQDALEELAGMLKG